jgi:hypothetical protein
VRWLNFYNNFLNQQDFRQTNFSLVFYKSNFGALSAISLELSFLVSGAMGVPDPKPQREGQYMQTLAR